MIGSLQLLEKHQALAWKCLSCACFAGIAALIRHLTTLPILPLPPLELAFFELFFGGVCFLCVCCARHPSFSVLCSPWIVARSLIASSGIGLWCIALSYVPLPVLSVFKLLSPILTVVAARAVLGETLSWTRLLALGLSLMGTGIMFLKQFQSILNSAGQTEMGYAFLPIAALMLLSLSHLMAKRLLQTVSAQTVTYGLLIWGSLFLLIPTLWHAVLPSLEHMPWLAGLGLLSGLAYYTLHRALQLADLSYLMPLSIVRFGLGAGLGYVCFGETLPPLLVLMVGGMVGLTVGCLRYEKA